MHQHTNAFWYADSNAIELEIIRYAEELSERKLNSWIIEIANTHTKLIVPINSKDCKFFFESLHIKIQQTKYILEGMNHFLFHFEEQILKQIFTYAHSETHKPINNSKTCIIFHLLFFSPANKA